MQTVKTIESELELMVQARYALFLATGPEEEPIEKTILAIAGSRNAQVFFWDMARGWSDRDTDKGNPMAALGRVVKASKDQPAIFVLKDIPLLIAPAGSGQISPNQLPIVRELKNLAKDLATDKRCVILMGATAAVPLELREEITLLNFGLPTPAEISDLLNSLVPPKKLKFKAADGREQLIKACQGLSRIRLQRVFAKALVSPGRVNESTIAVILEEKRSAIGETGILEFIPAVPGRNLETVGGLENLKQWVTVRSQSFSDRAREYGLPNPKGVLLAGIQGTGKSLVAKTIANEWHLPLLRLDVGRVFGGIVGESESRIREVIRLAEAIAPCCLWIDEIDKAFGNITSSSDGDSGTSRRVFGSLITWMQEKTAPVFIVATANNVELLPAELIRKGRLDELFFIHLPTQVERTEIYRVHLTRLRCDRVEDFDMGMLAAASKKFSGAEIEQAIYDGMQFGFSQNREFTQADILTAIHSLVPLAQVSEAQISNLRSWALNSGARSASIEEVEHSQATASLLVVDTDDLDGDADDFENN